MVQSCIFTAKSFADPGSETISGLEISVQDNTFKVYATPFLVQFIEVFWIKVILNKGYRK